SDWCNCCRCRYLLHKSVHTITKRQAVQDNTTVEEDAANRSLCGEGEKNRLDTWLVLLQGMFVHSCSMRNAFLAREIVF
ncbi:unnamed protein product, partial [Ectocarpus sp. 12 AP-2014]